MSNALCVLVIDGLIESMQELKKSVGQQFAVLNLALIPMKSLISLQRKNAPIYDVTEGRRRQRNGIF